MKILASILCLALSPLLAQAQEVELPLAIGEWAPYTGEKLADYGAATEIVTAACKAGGLKPKYVFSPWKRAEASVLDGANFATFPYLKTPERAETYEFSDPIFNSSIGIVRHTANAKTKDFKYKAIDDLKPFHVGTTAGTKAVADPLAKSGVVCEETAVLDQSVSKLQLGRIDFVIEERVATLDAIKRLYPGNVDDFKFIDGDFKE